MITHRQRVENTYWALVSLVSDCALEIRRRRVATSQHLAASLAPGTRVYVPDVCRGVPADVRVVARIAAAGMRPVVHVPAAGLRDRGEAARLLGVLADAGARELVTEWPSSVPLSTALDATVGLITSGMLARRGFTSVGVTGNLDSPVPKESSDLLRAFETAHAATQDTGVAVNLLARSLSTVDSVLQQERSLRAAGSLLPLHLRILGTAKAPYVRLVHALLAVASAIEADPGCLISGVHVVPERDVSRVAEFAEDLSWGNFVVEGTASDWSLTTLRRADKRRRSAA